MPLQFDRSTDPTPITAQLAVRRAQLLITLPSLGIMVIAFAWILIWLPASRLIAALGFPLGFVGGWLWWSYAIPLWRDWAHTRGVNPDELQRLAQQAQLVWPKGSIFEKTEFRRKSANQRLERP